MKFKKVVLPLLGATALSALPSCVAPYSADNPPKPNPNQKEILKAVYVNPHPAGTYAHFRARPDYKKTYDIWKSNTLLASTSPKQTNVVIHLGTQRALLYNGKKIIMDFPVATGTSKHPTPTGSFKILRKIEKEKRSNLYGKVLNSSGSVIKSGADSRKDAELIAKSGNRFEGAPMKYWMRLTNDGIGMHQGVVPRRPASHGCIRIYYKAVGTVFEKVSSGTTVSIVK